MVFSPPSAISCLYKSLSLNGAALPEGGLIIFFTCLIGFVIALPLFFGPIRQLFRFNEFNSRRTLDRLVINYGHDLRASRR